MAIPFLSSSVIRIVTERVLVNVLEQLPKAVASTSAKGLGEGATLVATNAAAIQTLSREAESLRGSIDQAEQRIQRLESRVGWRTYVWILITALIVYGIGFGTAIGLHALDVL